MANIRETFTIPENLVKKLNEHSAKSLIPKSKLISKLLDDYFNKQNEKSKHNK